jgi:cation transport ATPase
LPFVYDVALIPPAVGILYSVFQGMGGIPRGHYWLFGEYGVLQSIMAVAGLAFSSMIVATNSLRLKNISLN